MLKYFDMQPKSSAGAEPATQVAASKLKADNTAYARPGRCLSASKEQMEKRWTGPS